MMETNQHGMTNLFDQLGLPSAKSDIQNFIETHRPLDAKTQLCDAVFWTSAQADFLREQISADADWAVVIDKLDAQLRRKSMIAKMKESVATWFVRSRTEKKEE